jgi:hypothetical protein
MQNMFWKLYDSREYSSSIVQLAGQPLLCTESSEYSLWQMTAKSIPLYCNWQQRVFPCCAADSREYPSVVRLTAEYPSVVRLAAEYPSVVRLTAEYPSVVRLTAEYPSVVRLTAEYSSLVHTADGTVYSYVVQVTTQIFLCCFMKSDNWQHRVFLGCAPDFRIFLCYETGSTDYFSLVQLTTQRKHMYSSIEQLTAQSIPLLYSLQYTVFNYFCANSTVYSTVVPYNRIPQLWNWKHKVILCFSVLPWTSDGNIWGLSTV